MKDELSGTRRVDVLRQTPKADAMLVQRRDRLDEMLQRTTEPIQSPGDEGIALAQVEQGIMEPRPVGHRQRELLSKLLSTDSSSTAQVRMKSRFSKGRWDRNRTGALRFWSLLPLVQQRSGAYTSTLEMGYFEGPKYQEVHQRSPALGSTLGSSLTCSPRWGEQVKRLYGEAIELRLRA
jgi:hypothetical protein